MTKTPYRLSDLGDVFTWRDLKDFLSYLPPSGESAVFRVRFPQSWWWTPQFDFLSAILTSTLWGNWQRGGGKGDKPKPVKRPKEIRASKNDPSSADDLRARKNRVKRGR